MMRVVSIVGARPQFIKLAAVSRALRTCHEEIILHTGQHYDYGMSEQFFQELGIPEPGYHLNCGSGLHGAQTARMLEAIEQVLLKERPEMVMVYGDTNSTLAGTLAASKLHIPIAHVEAGLRSFNRAMPEEINRVVTDHLSDKLFCPTVTACQHLHDEGITRGVEMVGDVMYDLLLHVQPALNVRVRELLPSLHITERGYILVTVHRPANTDDELAMSNIASALNALEMPVIFPLHPRTRDRIERYRLAWGEHITFIEPVGYLDMLALERSAYRILTDSGGVQKEAFLLGIPCVTMREETEWPETLEAGWNILTGNSPAAIIAALNLPQSQQPRGNPFGEGDAAERIARGL
jgi:UDP-N-acetylglucosamine 2-epimerase